METYRSSIPGRTILAALALLGVATLTSPFAPPAAGAIVRPTEVEGPIERGGVDLGAQR